jgi:serine/threonine-protein kinase RsbT
MENEKGSDVIEVSVSSDEDVILARQKVRQLAKDMGFSTFVETRIVTAVSELARNIVVHAKAGSVSVLKIKTEDKEGLRVIFEDKGPGISDIGKALEEGFSTVGSMGIGLKGARRLVDVFDIDSSPGKGTKVVITKWK